MADSGPAKVAIIVVNYGSAELLERNLVPLSTALPGSTTVVVDNFSNEKERRELVALAERQGWHTVLPQGNEGFGGGMNLGASLAIERGATELLLLNPDATLAADQAQRLLERVRRDPLTLVSPTIVRPDGSLWFGGSDLYLDDGRIRSRRRRLPGQDARIFPWLSGACLALSVRLWTLVGGFDERYFLYWEDVDLSWRVVSAGGSLEVAGDVVAVHAEGGTQGEGHAAAGGRKSDLYYYYNIRNRYLFASLNLEPGAARAWSRVGHRVAWEILLQGGRRQFLAGPAPFLAAWRGLRDGRAVQRSASPRPGRA